MLNALLTLFKSAAVSQPFLHTANLLAIVENLVKMIGDDYLKDGNAKNAAIDALCEMLQQHKTQV